jgi:hypothetical protein
MFKFIVLAIMVLGCNPSTTPPKPDATDAAGSQCSMACANLRKLPCSDGFGVDGGKSCEALCTPDAPVPTFDMKPQCLIAAKTVADAIACGTVGCK